MRSFAILRGADQILPSPQRKFERNLPRENIFDNNHGEGNKQILYGYHPARDNINTVSGRTGSYQSLATNDQVLNPNTAGLDLHN